MILPIARKTEEGRKIAGNCVTAISGPCREDGEVQTSSIPTQKCVETEQVIAHQNNRTPAPRVFVLSQSGSPLMPCHPARAREFVRKESAKVIRVFPLIIQLIIQLTRTCAGKTQPLTTKIDPGQKTTGIALISKNRVLFKIELLHRQGEVSAHLLRKLGFRRIRRGNLWQRPARFLNRKNRVGKVPPSIQSIEDNILHWIGRLSEWAPVVNLIAETAKFNTQKIQDPEISGEEYQQGTLQGAHQWEYLLAKYSRKCAYGQSTYGKLSCQIAKNVKLTKDHVIPKCSGGSDRISNLTLACEKCNQAKGNLNLAIFLKEDPELVEKITAELKTPLRGAGCMNTLRNHLKNGLIASGIPCEFPTGAETKFNRTKFGIPKSHALDAAFTGNPAEAVPLLDWQMPSLVIHAKGRGRYQRTPTDKQGCPRKNKDGTRSKDIPRTKRFHGFQTGDIVRTPKGRGRIAVKSSGAFVLNGKSHINHKSCRLIQKADGYAYKFNQQPPLPPNLKDGIPEANY